MTSLFILSHLSKLSGLTHCCLSLDLHAVRIPRQLHPRILTSAELGAMDICHAYSPSPSVVFWCLNTHSFLVCGSSNVSNTILSTDY